MEENYRSNMRTEMDRNYQEFGRSFSESKFWKTTKKVAARAGIKVVYAALLLYYVLRSPATKTADRAKILGALGYFLLPFDLIPDWIPLAGYTDDLAALTWGLYCVARSITPEVKLQAREKLHEWFGDFDESALEGLF